ncbi:RNA polymerase sigma factor [Luteimonas aquatica]|uniref:RNA polymerase sigma factor n=1 Tax=Luteimonas aquatica TaxID=450364 RepID=UPI001F59625D|nr:RNA polymerase sigma factor [Luteimonas aquatica]
MSDHEEAGRPRGGEPVDGMWENWAQDRALLRGRAIRLTNGNVEDAEDILSSTVVKTLDYLHHHHDTVIRQPRAFLLFALNNEFISRCRRHAVESTQRDFRIDVDEHPGAGSAPSHERALQIKETLDSVIAAVSRLSPGYRALFRMRFEEERSYADIAMRLGVPQALVRKRIQLLRTRLKQMVDLSE